MPDIANFTKKFNLTSVPDMSDRLGIWSGKDFIFLESDWYLWNVAKLLYRYGFDLSTAMKMATAAKDAFLKLYERLKHTQFRSVEEW